MQNEPNLSQLCVRCGYDLRGVSDSSPCPECGMLAGHSRTDSPELWKSRPGWLRIVSAGIYLLLLAMLMALAWMPLYSSMYNWFHRALADWVGTKSAWYSDILEQSVLFGYDVSAALLLIGVFAVTRKESRPAIDGHHAALRRWTRAAAFLPLSGVMLLHGMMSIPRPTFYTPYSAFPGMENSIYINILQWTSTICLLVGGVALPFLLMRHLGTIARRVGHASISEHCTIVGSGMLVSVLVAPAVWWLIFTGLEDWGRGSALADIAIAVLAMVGASILLFALWWIYLMLRFAALFRKVSRESRVWWSDGDLAARTSTNG